VDEVADEITRLVPGTKTIVPNGLLHAIGGQLGAVTRLLYGSTLAVIIVAIPLLGTVSAMVAHERRREISLLRALVRQKDYEAHSHDLFSCNYQAFTCRISGFSSFIRILSKLLSRYP
jgi:hypothetical protein